jgi:hypothetical protein
LYLVLINLSHPFFLQLFSSYFSKSYFQFWNSKNHPIEN